MQLVAVAARMAHKLVVGSGWGSLLDYTMEYITVHYITNVIR